MLPISTFAGEGLSVDNKISEPKKTKVYCTSIYKKSANISNSLNKLWAEVINTIENVGNANCNEEIQKHAYPNSEEFEVSDE